MVGGQLQPTDEEINVGFHRRGLILETLFREGARKYASESCMSSFTVAHDSAWINGRHPHEPSLVPLKWLVARLARVDILSSRSIGIREFVRRDANHSSVLCMKILKLLVQFATASCQHVGKLESSPGYRPWVVS